MKCMSRFRCLMHSRWLPAAERWVKRMRVYTCKNEWEDMMTCIYEAWSSKLGHQNIRLEIEPIGQYSLFDEYVHVDCDSVKAQKVMDAVCRKISPYFYSKLAFVSGAYEEDRLDTIFKVMILGFAKGESALEMVCYREVMRFNDISKRFGGEIHKFREFLRFHQVNEVLYVAHIEPKSKVLLGLADSFSDRMPSEYWMIVDDVHSEVLVHPKDEDCYIQRLTKEELERLILTEKANDSYTDLWQVFFDSIAIKERENARCQTNLFPKWVRKHAVEFMKN